MVINLLGVILIAIIIWWFWIYSKKPVSTQGSNSITITVNNGVYTPARINIPAQTPITLRFLRLDPSPCAEYVIFNSLNLSKQLPLGKTVDIPINISKSGEYEFTCQMNMYRGLLIVGE